MRRSAPSRTATGARSRPRERRRRSPSGRRWRRRLASASTCARSARTPLVGREQELEALVGALDRARREREPQLVTLVGVPGIGKSRLVWELFQRLEQGPELIRWRQGRSLPYGEGVSYWALGEMVKAQAGILETDDAARAEEKLRETVAALVSDPGDVQWLERNLRPLVGLGTGGEAGADRRGEAFAAWRRFFEALAEQRPLVLVFEDLTSRTTGCSTSSTISSTGRAACRCSSSARRGRSCSRAARVGRRQAARSDAVAVASLRRRDGATRARAPRAACSRRGVRETLLERAAGNPLYAEEFVRMVEEHDPAEELPLPETVQGLIAARIDGLAGGEGDPPGRGRARKGLLARCRRGARSGRAVGGRGAPPRARAQGVRPPRAPLVGRGRDGVRIRHLLVRDVAYGQIPRPPRAEKHRQAAAWIASLARPEDQAEMVAHHYLSALELLRAAGRPTEEIAEQAGFALRDAGDRAFALNAFAHAAHLYEQSVELWPDEDPARPELLFRRAHALHLAADERQLEALEIARDALLETGTATAPQKRRCCSHERGGTAGPGNALGARTSRRSRFSTPAPRPRPGHGVLAQVSSLRGLDGDYEEAIRVGGEALAAAEALGLDEVRANALTTRGFARVDLGDDAGIGDLEESRRLALDAGALREASRACNNLGVALYGGGELARAFGLLEEALALAERAGHVDLMRFGQGMMLLPALDGGHWDDCVRMADAFIAECEAGAGHTLQASVHCHRGSIRLARNEIEGAVADAERALELAREVQQPDRVFQSLGFAVRALAASGALDRARELASEFDFLALEEGARPLRGPPSISPGRHRKWGPPTSWIGCSRVRGGRRPGPTPPRGWSGASTWKPRSCSPRCRPCRTRRTRACALPRGSSQKVGTPRPTSNLKAVAFFRSVGATRYLREAEAIRSAPAERRTSVSE